MSNIWVKLIGMYRIVTWITENSFIMEGLNNINKSKKKTKKKKQAAIVIWYTCIVLYDLPLSLPVVLA